jgi:hypothetical protein
MRDLSFITKVKKEINLLNRVLPDLSIMQHEITFTMHEVLQFMREFDRLQTELEKYKPFDDDEENV